MDHKVTFGGKPVTLVGNRCKAGEKAPSFTVIDAALQPVPSEDFRGKVRIFSVFPSVDTPVCSLQNIRFNREASKLGDDVVVLALSVDLPFAQKRFCAAEGIDRVHVFLDYKELDFGMKYGFVIDELRLLARGVVVVDRDDVVRYVEYVPRSPTNPTTTRRWPSCATWRNKNGAGNEKRLSAICQTAFFSGGGYVPIPGCYFTFS
ncbi:MAG: thiol peroxidase [Alistipes senegalensis]